MYYVSDIVAAHPKPPKPPVYNMTIVVSACLLGVNCKYNGRNNKNEKLLKWAEENHCKVIPVCPEVLGGLPTPRVPSEIVNGVVINEKGENVDAQFRAGAQKALEIVIEEMPDIIILQSRSPSCGVKEIYDGTFTKTRIPGSGIFAQLLKEKQFNVMDVKSLDFTGRSARFF